MCCSSWSVHVCKKQRDIASSHHPVGQQQAKLELYKTWRWPFCLKRPVLCVRTRGTLQWARSNLAILVVSVVIAATDVSYTTFCSCSCLINYILCKSGLGGLGFVILARPLCLHQICRLPSCFCIFLVLFVHLFLSVCWETTPEVVKWFFLP